MPRLRDTVTVPPGTNGATGIIKNETGQVFRPGRNVFQMFVYNYGREKQQECPVRLLHAGNHEVEIAYTYRHSYLIKFPSYTTIVPEWVRSALEHNNSISIESNVGEIQGFSSFGPGDMEVVPLRGPADVTTFEDGIFGHACTITFSINEIGLPIDIMAFRPWGAADTLGTMLHERFSGRTFSILPAPLAADVYADSSVLEVDACGGPFLASGEMLEKYASQAIIKAVEYTVAGGKTKIAYLKGDLSDEVISGFAVFTMKEYAKLVTDVESRRALRRRPSIWFGAERYLLPSTKVVKVRRAKIIKMIYIVHEDIELDGRQLFGEEVFVFNGVVSHTTTAFRPTRRFGRTAGIDAVLAAVPCQPFLAKSTGQLLFEMVDHALDEPKRNLYPFEISAPLPYRHWLALNQGKLARQATPKYCESSVVRKVFSSSEEFEETFGTSPPPPTRPTPARPRL